MPLLTTANEQTYRSLSLQSLSPTSHWYYANKSLSISTTPNKLELFKRIAKTAKHLQSIQNTGQQTNRTESKKKTPSPPFSHTYKRLITL